MSNVEQVVQETIIKSYKPTKFFTGDRVDNLIIPSLLDKNRDNICRAVNIKQLEDVKPRNEETKYKLQ